MTKRSPLTFFVLVFALSAPFWLLGSVSDLQLMPGLSVSLLMAFCPMIAAALLLVSRESGATGVRNLVKRSIDFRRIPDKRWYLPIVSALLMFAACFIGALGEEVGWRGFGAAAPSAAPLRSTGDALAYTVVGLLARAAVSLSV